MNVVAVIVAHQGAPVIADPIRTLMAGTRPPDAVVVVDNASTDATVRTVTDQFPAVEVLHAGGNLGYGHAMNLGMTRARELDAGAILCLTQEVTLAPDALALLVARLESAADLGAVGPLLGYRSQPDRVWSAGADVDRRIWYAPHRGRMDSVDEWAGRPPVQVEWLDGACILFRADAVTTAGPIDPEYFLYYEEVDYFMRLRELGYRAECVPAAVAWQEPGLAPEYLKVRNRLRLAAKRGTRRDVALLVARIVREEWKPRDAYRAPGGRRERLRGLLHFLTGRFGPVPSGVALRPSSQSLVTDE